MRLPRFVALLALISTLSCQRQALAPVSIVDGARLLVVSADGGTPSAILAQARIPLGPADQLLLNGFPIGRDSALNGQGGRTLQIRRAVNVSLDGVNHATAARTVGEALAALGTMLYAADGFSPAAGAFLTGPVAILRTPSRLLTVHSGGEDVQIRSSAAAVGSALAGAGLPLLGLDFSRPAENEPVPPDGSVQVVRVSESIILAEKSIPFQNQFKQSADIELGQEQILQPGQKGLAVSRVRIRYEDGQEVSRETEDETVVRPPQDRIAAQGTKIVVKTATINGVTIQYWRAMQMYATVYSPCTSGGAHGCSSGTASGLPAGKGVVAVDPGLYAYLNGQRLYIPGYGRAVIGDIGGGSIIEQTIGVSRYRWIDLGFDDNNIVDMTGWITVYFLAPAPASIPDILK